jgi:hypothetical protein
VNPKTPWHLPSGRGATAQTGPTDCISPAEAERRSAPGAPARGAEGRAVTPRARPGSGATNEPSSGRRAGPCREGRRSSAPTKEALDDDSRSRTSPRHSGRARARVPASVGSPRCREARRLPRCTRSASSGHRSRARRSPGAARSGRARQPVRGAQRQRGRAGAHEKTSGGTTPSRGEVRWSQQPSSTLSPAAIWPIRQPVPRYGRFTCVSFRC